MRRGALRLALLLALLAPVAGAQSILPEPSPYRDQLVLVNVSVQSAGQDVELNGEVRYEVLVEDLSQDQAQGRGILHTITLELLVNRSRAAGWNAFLGPTFFSPSFGGDVFRTFVVVQATPTVQSPFFAVTLRATLRSSTGQVVSHEQDIVTRLVPFSLATVDVRYQPRPVAPFEAVAIPFVVTNVGQYPDTFLIEAEGPPGWFVAVQPRLGLFPGESREAAVNVLTPADRIFVPQETGVILLRVRSELEPNVVYERSAVVVVEGVFLPDYWLPLLALGAVLAAATGREAARRARRRARELGRPAPLRVTPAQRLLLRDLKRRDPARHRALVARQRSVQRARERLFARLREKRAAVERSLVVKQHAVARERKRAERERAKAIAAREAALQREREALERAERRRARALVAAQRRAERERLRRERAIQRAARLRERRAERLRRARERRLRAELARRHRLLRGRERRRRLALERRARELARRKRALERRGRRRRGGKGPPPGEAGMGDAGGKA